MQRSRLVLVRFRAFVQLFDDPINEPPLVCYGKIDDVTPQEPAVIHQYEGGLEDELLSISGPQAKET